ncbi:hypothetical protein [Rhodococcus sp. 077-4]|uniref:hypothetical protein n=1 Tax=Rhodococcus sp. 077-4 TaxID=2789271 RepID=UPI0039F47863
MSLRLRLLRVAALLGLFMAVGYLLPELGPQAPDSYQGVARPVTTTTTALLPRGSTAPTSTRVGPPPGFPSMEFPPPENQVPEGDPIPIDTKYGIRYTVPGDWRFQRGGVTGWSSGDQSLRFGDIADYGYDYCPEFHDGATKARTGITGRHGVDIPSAAFAVSREAELIFRDTPDDEVVIDFSEPTDLQVEGIPAVRYTVTASNLPRKYDCDPPAASIDIVAMQGYSNATVAVFMVLAEKETDGALSRDTIDGIVSSLRKSP